MTDQKTTIINGDSRSQTVSDEISAAVQQASAKIDRLDADPIIRLALARVTIRTFTREMVSSYPDHAADLAIEFEAMADLIRNNDSLPAEIRRALNTEDEAAETATDGEDDVEDRQSGSEAGRRGQTDTQGRQSGGARGKGARDHGPKRVGKEHTVLRVGGT